MRGSDSQDPPLPIQTGNIVKTLMSLPDDPRGERIKFIAKLCKERHANLLRFLRKRAANLTEVDDLAQETYLELLRHQSDFRHVRDPAAYLITTASHVAARSSARRARDPDTVSLDPEATELQSEPPTEDERNEVLNGIILAQQVNLAFAALPPQQQSILVLKELEGMSSHEIAHRSGLSVDQVERRYTAARDKMKSLLGNVMQGRVRK